jgi:hypothetical protein
MAKSQPLPPPPPTHSPPPPPNQAEQLRAALESLSVAQAEIATLSAGKGQADAAREAQYERQEAELAEMRKQLAGASESESELRMRCRHQAQELTALREENARLRAAPDAPDPFKNDPLARTFCFMPQGANPRDPKTPREMVRARTQAQADERAPKGYVCRGCV